MGRLHLVLDGEKAKGEWSLIRTRMDGGKPQWLLLKSGNSIRPISKKRDDQSVKTGRTMAQIAAERDAEWQSNRDDKSKSKLIKAPPKKKDDRQEKSKSKEKRGRRSPAAAGFLAKERISEIAGGEAALHSADEAKVARRRRRRPAIGFTN